MKPDLKLIEFFSIKKKRELKYIFILESVGYRRESFSALRCIISLSRLATGEESVN